MCRLFIHWVFNCFCNSSFGPEQPIHFWKPTAFPKCLEASLTHLYLPWYKILKRISIENKVYIQMSILMISISFPFNYWRYITKFKIVIADFSLLFIIYFNVYFIIYFNVDFFLKKKKYLPEGIYLSKLNYLRYTSVILSYLFIIYNPDVSKRVSKNLQ